MFRLCLLLTLALSLLTACAPPPDPLAYQCAGMALTLAGRVDSLDFAADLTLAPVPDGASPDDRAFALTYTSPPSLAGLTLTRDGATTTLTRGAVRVDAADGRFADMTLPAVPFCIDCPIGSAAVETRDNATLTRVTAADDEGDYTLWLDERGYPRRIEATVAGRSIALDVEYPTQ